MSFNIDRDEILGLIGPNGAGKTTTMRILMGLIRPSDGWASVLGEDINGNGLARRSRIGYLPQDPSFFPRVTVRRTLRFVARRYLSGSKSAIESKVDETLDLVGLDDRADRKVKALSGGERRRLGIGQAVIGDPDLLILDEPSVGLDPEGRSQVLDLLEALKERMTIFYSSHILDDVERIADHVIVLDQGEIIEQGPMESFLGGGAAVYRVWLDGDGAGAVGHLHSEPWVGATRMVDPGVWEIEVAEREAAEHQLLRMLHGHDGTRVTELRPEQRNLEDIYLDLVGAVDDD
ncbi:MAG: ABC transporter ATP-binding protein [Acidimicrobiia bacterium]